MIRCIALVSVASLIPAFASSEESYPSPTKIDQTSHELCERVVLSRAANDCEYFFATLVVVSVSLQLQTKLKPTFVSTQRFRHDSDQLKLLYLDGIDIFGKSMLDQ